MILQTKIPLEQQSHNCIDYNSKLVTIGSCFSDHIGGKLEAFKFVTTRNPMGILFHPKAIETLIADAVGNVIYNSKDVFQHHEQWHSFKAHSVHSNSSKATLLAHLNAALQTTRDALLNATHVTITLGTAWVYQHLDSQAVVANCHKVPQSAFQKKLLSVAAIGESLKRCVALIHGINPKATIIFTVSPVRHLKDGFIENTRSKSHLITAIHETINLVEKENPSQLHYFPAYEIMMDELRDYRFYTSDMIHPSALAIDYIWEHFTTVWMTPATLTTLKKIATLLKRLQHKAFHPDSEAHQAFLKKTRLQIQELQRTYPNIEFR